jgi:hypothetical protein
MQISAEGKGDMKSQPPTGGQNSAFERWISGRANLIFAAILLLTLFADLRHSAGKPLWYDELFTVGQALQPTLHGLLQGAIYDGTPPTYALACKPLVHLFGTGDLIFRLPSLIAFFAAYLILYAILLRRAGAISALTAVAFLCSWDKLAWYATEARSYGFLFLFTAVTLAGWLLASEDLALENSTAGKHRRLGLVLLLVGIAGAILSHHLGLLNAGIPLAAGILTQTLHRRRIDTTLCLTAILGAATQCLTLPLILHSHRGLPAAGADASLHILLHDYAWMLALPALAAILLLLTKKSSNAPPKTPQSSALLAATIACIGLPLLLAILLHLTHTLYGGFRYGIACYLGAAILLALLLARLRPNIRLACALILLLPFLHWVARPQQPHTVPALALAQSATQPVVIQDPGDYMQTWWYATPAVRPRLHFIELRDFGPPQNAAAVKTFYLSPYLPMPMDNYAAFLHSNPRFDLLVTHQQGSTPPDYLYDELRADGYTFTPIADANVTYGKIRQTRVLYEVAHP